MESGKSSSVRFGKSRHLLSSDLGESLGKVPPQALDLEEAVLGALMLEKDALQWLLTFLKPRHSTKTAIKRFTGDC